MIRLLSTCMLFLLAVGCSSAPHSDDRHSREAYEEAKVKITQREEVKPRDPNEVAPGYEIKLTTMEDPHLNGNFRIEFEGRLKLPYNVTLSTDGMTLDRLRAKIKEAYSSYFKTPPDIKVSVSEERFWVDVRGLVEKAGRFLLKKSTSLDEVLALAGGLQKNANVGYVKIIQGKNSTTIKLSEYYSGAPSDRIPPWRGGDILFFQTDRGQTPQVGGDLDKSYVQLIGEVRTPGEVRYVEGEDFYYYLVKAGGPTAQADLRNVRIMRDGRNGIEGKRAIDFGLDEMNQVPSIQPGDILFLKSDKPTAFERAVPLISTIVGILNTILIVVLVH